MAAFELLHFCPMLRHMGPSCHDNVDKNLVEVAVEVKFGFRPHFLRSSRGDIHLGESTHGVEYELRENGVLVLTLR